MTFLLLVSLSQFTSSEVCASSIFLQSYSACSACIQTSQLCLCFGPWSLIFSVVPQAFKTLLEFSGPLGPCAAKGVWTEGDEQ